MKTFLLIVLLIVALFCFYWYYLRRKLHSTYTGKHQKESDEYTALKNRLRSRRGNTDNYYDIMDTPFDNPFLTPEEKAAQDREKDDAAQTGEEADTEALPPEIPEGEEGKPSLSEMFSGKRREQVSDDIPDKEKKNASAVRISGSVKNVLVTFAPAMKGFFAKSGQSIGKLFADLLAPFHKNEE